MNFLSPWFLVGAALIAGPIIAHLIRQVTRKRITFSATRFLNPSPPQMDRRNRIQHPWLLLLRCLIVLALALAFARPYFHHDLPAIIAPTPPQSVIAVLDQSASMQRAGLWDAACKKVEEAAADLGPNDQFALFGVSGEVRELISHERWQDTPVPDRATMVRGVLADLKPGWGPKNLDAAIEAAAGEWESMTEAANNVTRKKIVVVSDFAQGAKVAGLAGMNWPAGCEVNLQPVLPDHPGDAGLQWLSWSETDNGPALRVLVSQSEKSTTPALSLQMRNARTNVPIGDPQKLTVEAKDQQIAVFPVPADAMNEPLRVDLTGDQENFDNTVWAVRPTPRQMTLVYYGDHDVNDIKHARFYVERAVAGWKDPVVSVVAATSANISAAAPAPAPAPSPGLGQAAPVTTPVDLFNGKNLDGWSYFDGGKLANVASVVQIKDNGVLAVSNQKDGYLVLDPAHENYQLHVEWRWTTTTPPADTNGGVLLNISPGALQGNIWPVSFQVQTKVGRAGDILAMSSASSAEAAAGATANRQKDASEKPAGEWNTADIIVRGDTIECSINGVAQNKVTQCVPSSGKIGFQLEGYPYELRNLRVLPLLPETTAKAKTSAEFFVVAGALDAAQTQDLRDKLAGGDFAVVLLNDPARVATAAALAGESGWAPITPAQKNPLFGQIDFQNPLFSLFADPHYSDFTHIQFWQAQSVKLPDKTAAVVAAKFDDGSPAVIEAPVGAGRVIIWGGDWSTAAGSWVLSTKFVPWLQALFEREAGGALRPSVAEIGDLTRLLGGEPAKWRALDAPPDAAFVETTPTLPGVYQIQQGDTTRWVALEVPAAAGNIDPMTTEAWEKLGVPLHAQPLTSATPVAAPVGQDQTAPALEARQKMWRWLLLGAVFLLALESIYSLALSRRREQNTPEAST